jgi:hypothetical protein
VEKPRFFQGGSQADIPHMRIDGGGGDILVAEQPLEKSQIHAVFEEKGRAGVTQHVGGDAAVEARFFGEAPEQMPRGLRGPSPAIRAQERLCASSRGKSAEETRQPFVHDEDAAFTPALAANMEAAAVNVEVVRA